MHLYTTSPAAPSPAGLSASSAALSPPRAALAQAPIPPDITDATPARVKFLSLSDPSPPPAARSASHHTPSAAHHTPSASHHAPASADGAPVSVAMGGGMGAIAEPAYGALSPAALAPAADRRHTRPVRRASKEGGSHGEGVGTCCRGGGHDITSAAHAAAATAAWAADGDSSVVYGGNGLRNAESPAPSMAATTVTSVTSIPSVTTEGGGRRGRKAPAKGGVTPMKAREAAAAAAAGAPWRPPSLPHGLVTVDQYVAAPPHSP